MNAAAAATDRPGFPRFAEPLSPVNVSLRRCAAGRSAASHRVLIARTIAAGDILMSTPLLSALREAWPDAHLTYLVERNVREAVDANPCVDELLPWDTRYWKNMTRRGLYPLWFVRAFALRRLLHERRFDVFISLQPEDWSLLPRHVGAPVRIGVFDTFREYHRRDRTSRRTRLYTHAFTHADLPPHRTDQYLLPLQALGIDTPRDKRMTMGYTADDVRAAERFLAAQDGDRGPGARLVVIAPRTGWPSRSWPPERYAELADRLAQQAGCRVLLSGTAHERAAVDEVAGLMRTRPLVAAGALTFRQMAALIGRAGLVVSGDTGPMHVAAAVGTPFLALFGPTPPARFAPLAGRGLSLLHPVPCGPCHQYRCPIRGEDHLRCLRLISVEEALAAATRLLTGEAQHDGDGRPASPVGAAAPQTAAVANQGKP